MIAETPLVVNSPTASRSSISSSMFLLSARSQTAMAEAALVSAASRCLPSQRTRAIVSGTGGGNSKGAGADFLQPTAKAAMNSNASSKAVGLACLPPAGTLGAQPSNAPFCLVHIERRLIQENAALRKRKEPTERSMG